MYIKSKNKQFHMKYLTTLDGVADGLQIFIITSFFFSFFFFISCKTITQLDDTAELLSFFLFFSFFLFLSSFHFYKIDQLSSLF